MSSMVIDDNNHDDVITINNNNQQIIPIKCLVLGGNGMMGSDFIYHMKTIVQQKYKDKYQFKITTLNRGNHYWDSQERVDPFIVDKIICDRKKIKKYGEKIFVNNRKSYDYVIDFSGYKRKFVKYIINNGPDIKKMYIFISTDSVYEVCKPITKSPIVEDCAVRPKDKIEQEKLNAKDDYGNDKLKCEEYLRLSTTSTTTTTANNNNNPFKYLILRLPDVIGPRDNTDRSFNYFLWLRTHKDIGIPLHLKKKNSNLSFVHCSTVASVVCESIEMNLLFMKNDDNNINNNIENEIFNIVDGHDNGTPLKDFLTIMGKAMGIDNINFATIDQISSNNSSDDEDDILNTYYPSTTLGPITSSKAQKQFIKYKPNDLFDVMHKTVQFYDHVMKLWVNNTCNETIKEQIDEIVYEDIIDELNMNAEQRKQFLDSLKKYYKGGNNTAL